MIIQRPARNKIYINSEKKKKVLHQCGDEIFTFPMANRPLSNNNIIPRKMKPTPNIVRPRPISRKSHEKNVIFNEG